MKQIPPAFHRVHLLAGDRGIETLHNTRVIILGVGGVGSWCAEALVRSVIGNLTLVDSDCICVTNINRQVQALPSTVGNVKVTELAKRLKQINPDASITTLQKLYDRKTSDTFTFSEYDYVIDAIDSLSSKVELMIRACESGATLFSALGASARLDPRNIKVSSIWKTQKCRLGRFVRKRLRRRGFSGDFTCVYSDEEPLEQFEGTINRGTGDYACPDPVRDNEDDSAPANEWYSAKEQINGSVVHITGTFGFILAGLVVQDVIERAKEGPRSG